MLKVLITDDEQMICNLIANILDWEDMGFQIIGMANTGTDAFDILAVDKKGKAHSIQVKTTQYEKKLKWLLSSKDENPKADFYVFVNLNGIEKQPDYYIMEAKEVAAAIKEEHETWLATPKRDGTAHKPINMRQIILDQQDVSKGRWELITGETQNGKE